MLTGKDKIFFNKQNSLTKEMYKNVLFNYGFRGIGILLGLVTTSVNLSYLGASLYGQWATIASIASWINYGDFGIGNGLRNELAQAVAEEDTEKQKRLIVTAAKMLGKVAVLLFGMLTLITEVLFVLSLMDDNMRLPMYITNFFFCLDLFLGVGRSVAYSYQKSWLTSLAQTTTAVVRIVGVKGLALVALPSLTAFAMVSGFGGVIGNFILFLILKKCCNLSFGKKLEKYNDSGLNKKIAGLGLQFFALQLTGLILYSSDNLIINNILSSEEVTKYEIISKVYITGENLFAILLVSLWSAVTFAVTKKDFIWIENELKRLLKIWMVFSIGVVCVSVFLNPIIRIWLGENNFLYESNLVILFAIYTILTTFGSIYINITNGLGRLKIQMFFSCIEAIVNIPLSIFFARGLNMGIFGVKLATLICCTSSIIIIPIDVIIYLNKRKKEGKNYAREVLFNSDKEKNRRK